MAIADKPGFFGFDLSNTLPMYFMALIFFLLSYWGLRRLLNAPLGHVFVGIRENEPRMLAIGYPTRAYKLLAFTIAGGWPVCRRPLRHLQQLYLARCGVLDCIGRHFDYDDPWRRGNVDWAGDRRRSVSPDEERREFLQRSLAADYRRGIYRLRTVLSRRDLGNAARTSPRKGPVVSLLRTDRLYRSFGSLVVTDN